MGGDGKLDGKKRWLILSVSQFTDQYYLSHNLPSLISLYHLTINHVMSSISLSLISNLKGDPLPQIVKFVLLIFAK